MIRTLRPAQLATRQFVRLSTTRPTPARTALARLHSTAGGHTHNPSSTAGPARHWLVGSLAAATALTLTLRPELNPFITSASALSLPPSTYLDPTTQTAFPSSLPSPSAPLQLVGTGVRTVSFLAVRVYTAGFYLAEGALSQPALRGFTPERLISPRPEDEGLVGEELMGTVLEGTSAGVVIVPLRNTTLTHLRDAFTRALVARLKLPAVAASLTPEQLETASLALSEFKALFPARNLAKGSRLELLYDAKAKTDPSKPDEIDTMGTLAHPILAKQLLVSYFNNVGAGSPELVRSVAHGLAGEPRA